MKDWKWRRLGRVLTPDPEVKWLSTHTGPAFAVPDDKNPERVVVYIAGRDRKNRSLIGKVWLSRSQPSAIKVEQISEHPVLSLGERGAFDENGTSYPCLVRQGKRTLMYYVGWRPTVLTPFMLQLGVAEKLQDERFKRISRAPILPLNNEEPFGTGSVFVLFDMGKWKMWYTSFQRWGDSLRDHKHYYNIKYAESNDGVNWHRPNIVCIDFLDPTEYAICRPSVLKFNDKYYMWFAFRGERYRIGLAHSEDGIHWYREENSVRLSQSTQQWDTEAQSYPHVFKWGSDLYMLYCGNEYGKEGLGLALLEYSNKDERDV